MPNPNSLASVGSQKPEMYSNIPVRELASLACAPPPATAEGSSEDFPTWVREGEGLVLTVIDRRE